MAWSGQTDGQWFRAWFGICSQFVDYVPLCLHRCSSGIPLIATDPVIRRIFEKSPENIQAQQEKAFLVALGVDEEE